MSVHQPPLAAQGRVAGYRFDGVVLDLHRGSLMVDGAAVATTPLLLQLLQILCASGGRLLARQELFDALWPGGQTVSDAALSQLVWRLRSLLGPYGERVATVRRGGLRLDAAVQTDYEPPPAVVTAAVAELAPAAFAGAAAAAVAGAAAAAVTDPRTAAAPAPRRRAGRIAVFVAVLAAVAAAGYAWLHDPLISDGYALHASDLQLSRRDSARLSAAAFAADKAGDRERAVALMRSLHDTDPSTPMPAAMLAWWRSFASADEAARWREAARARLRPDTPPYLRLYVDYFVARSGTEPIRGPLNALLDLRPGAWHFQYTRAHNQLATREFAGALRSLQQIPLDLPDNQLMADVLADRVSLGDRAAADLPAQQPGITGNAVLEPYVRGRIAYSESRLADAVAAWDQSAAAAVEIRQYERQLTASEEASLAAFEAGAADALPRIAATRRLCQAQARLDCETAMLGFLAVIDARRGEAARASATLAEAWQMNPHVFLRPALLLVAFENELAVPGDTAAVAAEIADQPAFAGVAELLRGWRALAAGQPEQAARELDLALERGVAQTYNAEDAALLGARLGRAAPPCRVDPPYPNVLRLSACQQLRERINQRKINEVKH